MTLLAFPSYYIYNIVSKKYENLEKKYEYFQKKYE